MIFVRKLKLYRIKTVLKFCYDSIRNSAFIRGKTTKKSRVSLYFDMIYCFLRYGADFNDYSTFSFWDKTEKERDSYITLRRNNQLRFALSTPQVYEIFLNKAEFNTRYQKYVQRAWISTQTNSFAEVETFINQYRCVIVKPLTDYGGHGVLKLDISEPDAKKKLENLKKSIDRGLMFIIEQTITNCDELRKLAPSSLNTLRLVTVLDQDKKLHIVAAVMRMGNGFSVTDNYHDGGMACAVDIEKGCLTGFAFGMNCAQFTSHPYTNITFDGFQVPHFEDCLKIVSEISFYEPEARYVGWDFAITPDRIELLEGNIPPGEDITQIAAGCGLWYQIQNWV